MARVEPNAKDKPRKFEHIYKDDDGCESIWKYDLDKFPNGPISVENKYPAGYVKDLKQRQKLAKAERSLSILEKANKQKRMKVEGKNYCDTSKVYVAPIAKSIAKDIIVKKHYTHAWTACRYAIGIYYKSEDANTFDGDKLIGCLIYGFPVGAKASTSICEGLTKDNILELTRLYCDDGYGSNIESFALGQSFKWLKEYDKAIKVLLSYADNGQAHLGGIYQATNWIYQGLSTDIALMPNWGISLHKDPYQWIHSRTVFSMWGSGNLAHLQMEIGKQGYKEFWRREEPPKHRYVQLLAQDKKRKKDLMKRLKHEIRPYPKDTASYNTEVVHHLTTYEVPEGTENFW